MVRLGAFPETLLALSKGKKKKKEEDKPTEKLTSEITDKPTPVKLEPEVTTRLQQEAGKAFIQAREKALSQGADKRQATSQAQEQTANIGQEAFNPKEAQDVKTAQQNLGVLTPEQQNLNLIQGEGVVDTAQIGRGVVKGAIAGGTFGAIGGPIGVGVGAIGGAFLGALTEVSLDQAQDVKTAYRAGRTANGNLNALISNGAKLNPLEFQQRLNNEISILYASERTLKQMTSTKVGRELSRATDELAAVQAQIRLLPIKLQMAEMIIANPQGLAIPFNPEQIEVEMPEDSSWW